MAEAQQQQQQGGQVDAAAARAYVAPYVTDPAILAGLPDDKVLEYHGRVVKEHEKIGSDAVAKHRETYDWRKDIAGDDAEALKTLGTMDSPKTLYKSYGELRGKLSKGELKAVVPFPEKGTDEQKAAWRTENAIPASPEKYEIKLPEGVKVGEKDKPAVDEYLKYAHANNLPTNVVNANLAYWASTRAKREEEAHLQEKQMKQETEDVLRKEWGNDYRLHQNRIDGMLDSTVSSEDKELRKLIRGALDTNPAYARHYAQLALIHNPAGVIMDGGGNQGKAVEDEIKELETLMRTKRAEWNKDQGKQERLQVLYGHREKLAEKAKG